MQTLKAKHKQVEFLTITASPYRKPYPFQQQQSQSITKKDDKISKKGNSSSNSHHDTSNSTTTTTTTTTPATNITITNDVQQSPNKLSHFQRRIATEKLILETAQDFPGVSKINRITIHRLYEDYEDSRPGFVVCITIEVDDSYLSKVKELGASLQKSIEGIRSSDNVALVLECDVHLDLTTIPSEKPYSIHKINRY